MKKQIIIAAATLGTIVFGTTAVKAQTTATSNAATTNVRLILQDVISIDAGSVASGGQVDFNYTNTTDYNTAKNVEVKNSLIVTSSKKFNVNVKAGGIDFVNGDAKIPVSVLQIKATEGGTMTGTKNPAIKLSTTDQALVSGADLGARRSLNIDYSIAAKDAQDHLLGKPEGTYTQTVIYTATAL
ncbi:MAG: peptidoglycan-binding protein LysM [Chryseobacterium sp.]|nr:MAG: peptidoglycan-binding protein LysM [Chryseobacterium sp.]